MENGKKGVMWVIPKELHEKLLIEAENNKRSVTQTAIVILESYFDVEDVTKRFGRRLQDEKQD